MYDIEQFVTRHFEDYRYYGNPPTEIQICCPFCDDTKYHFNIHLNPDKQVVHCFKCGHATTWIHFVMEITKLPYWRVVGELYSVSRVKEDMKGVLETKMKPATAVVIDEHHLPDDFVLLSERHKTVLCEEARLYLKRRGFGKYFLKRYMLGASESVGWRVIIPIERDYWQGRALYKWLEPKYINPKEPARDIIFNPRALDVYNEIVVCEGAFSAMAVGDNAIAIIGKEPTPERIERISDSSADTVIIALEAGAFGSMQKLADAMGRCGKKVVIWKYDTGDPADSNPVVRLDYGLKSKIFLMINT